jgi:hypothetical protein
MNIVQENVVEPERHNLKVYTIIVNGRRKEVVTDEVSYEEVVRLAYGGEVPTGPNIIITVTYRNAAHDKQGTLLPGQTVEIKDGTIFNVTATNRS